MQKVKLFILFFLSTLYISDYIYAQVPAEYPETVDLSSLKTKYVVKGIYQLSNQPMEGVTLTVKIKQGEIKKMWATHRETGKRERLDFVLTNLKAHPLCFSNQTVNCYETAWEDTICFCGGYYWAPNSEND